MVILENRIKFTKSYELYERSCKSYWHGTTQSKTPENYIPGQFPLFIEKSKGAYLWDIDGNRYTDYIMATAPFPSATASTKWTRQPLPRSETAL